MALANLVSSLMKEEDVAKTEWGIKRTCTNCGSRFYDLYRDPIVCPKCDVTFVTTSVRRKQRMRAQPSAELKEAKSVLTNNAGRDALVQTDDVKFDDGKDLGTADEAAEDESLIEDASELGEDKDDMFEVIDKVSDEGQESR